MKLGEGDRVMAALSLLDAHFFAVPRDVILERGNTSYSLKGSRHGYCYQQSERIIALPFGEGGRAKRGRERLSFSELLNKDLSRQSRRSLCDRKVALQP